MSPVKRETTCDADSPSYSRIGRSAAEVGAAAGRRVAFEVDFAGAALVAFRAPVAFVRGLVAFAGSVTGGAGAGGRGPGPTERLVRTAWSWP